MSSQVLQGCVALALGLFYGVTLKTTRGGKDPVVVLRSDVYTLTDLHNLIVARFGLNRGAVLTRIVTTAVVDVSRVGAREKFLATLHLDDWTRFVEREIFDCIYLNLTSGVAVGEYDTYEIRISKGYWNVHNGDGK
ncbi:hypothetical protein K440DRAFT_632579 [Wilcoxina mikolae CBS 423.85]|nr:hypothetical protein K440DRAFT_632579 [Wilcoxina mikolae CBS 423.85]